MFLRVTTRYFAFRMGPIQVDLCYAFVLLILAMCHVSTSAQDWPQVLGPTRDGVAGNDLVPQPWDGVEPPTRWSHAAGQGMAGVAVEGDHVALFHRQGDNEVVELLDRNSGDLIWSRTFPTRYRCTYNSDSGPRCVPLILPKHVIVFGAGGRLASLRRTDGDVLWNHDTAEEYAAPEGYFGAGSSPIHHDGRIIVNIGGRGRFGIVAFELDSGSIDWTIPDEAASYSSPVIAQVADATWLTCITRMHFIMADVVNGKVAMRIPFGRRGPTVNAASPVLFGSHVFLTASYGVGARSIDLASPTTPITWEDSELLSSQYTTPVLHEGTFYGIDGRADVGSASLVAVDPRTRERLWQEDDFGMATLIRVRDRLLILKTDGTLVLTQCDRTRFRELDRVTLTRDLCRALPAYARGCLFVRDATTLRCFELASGTLPQ